MDRKVAKFNVQDMLPIGLTLVVTGIGLAYGLDVMGDTKDDFTKADPNFGSPGCSLTDQQNCTNDAAYNATADSISGVGKLPEKMPLIVNVIVAAIIIGILVRYLMVRYG